jgi:hypothetical protein
MNEDDELDQKEWRVYICCTMRLKDQVKETDSLMNLTLITEDQKKL